MPTEKLYWQDSHRASFDGAVARIGSFDGRRSLVLDRTLLRRLKVESWQQALGAFNLPLASESNVGEWLNAIDSWVASAGAALAALRQAALEQLLLAEAQVGRLVRGGAFDHLGSHPIGAESGRQLAQRLAVRVLRRPVGGAEQRVCVLDVVAQCIVRGGVCADGVQPAAGRLWLPSGSGDLADQYCQRWGRRKADVLY